MFWPFTRKKDANEARKERVSDALIEARIGSLERRCADLEEKALEERQKAFAFRGRVYAYLGKKGVKLSAEDAPEPTSDAFDWTTCPLDDPRLTKAQVKHRLNLTTAAGQARRLKPN